MTINFVLLNNTRSKPKVLLPYGTLINSAGCKHDNAVCSPSFDIIAPNIIDIQANKPYTISDKDQSHTFFLAQNISNDTNNKQECILHTGKPIYTEDEVISVSYANLYGNYDTNLNTVEILIYRPGDVPGFTRSFDWLDIKYLDKNLGTSNTIYFPRDGERNVEKFTEGEYTIRLMYKYKDICPPAKIKVIKPDKNNDMYITAPPPGSFRIYKLTNDTDRIYLNTDDNNKCLAIAFGCNNKLMDLLVDFSFLSNTDRSIIEYIENHNPAVDYTFLLTSYLKSLIYNSFSSLLCNSVKNHSNSYDNDPSREVVTQIKNYVIHKILEPITIDTLATHFYFSKSHISHLFKEITGMSINKYISQARILKATELLCKNDMSITEIAEALNYSDIHTFSHKFKKETGKSPSQLKAEYNKIYIKIKK